MKLIAEIIELLSDDKSSTQSALLKAQVLAHRLGDAALASWVGNELRGYPREAELPSYRVLPARVMGNISNGFYSYKNTTISLEALDSSNHDMLTKRRVFESISTLETWVGSQHLQIPLDPVVCTFLSTSYENGYAVQSAHLKFGAGAISQLLIQIRSRLLEFCLLISDKFPSEMTNPDARTKAEEVGAQDVFRNAIFGDGATVIVNGGHISNVSNTISKNDIESLIRSLKRSGVGEADLLELQQAIEQDALTIGKKTGSLGPRVKMWIGGMVAKAGTTSWNVSIGAAGNLLATAVEKYYGL